jgi:hypothetical protein
VLDAATDLELERVTTELEVGLELEVAAGSVLDVVTELELVGGTTEPELVGGTAELELIGGTIELELVVGFVLDVIEVELEGGITEL